MGLFTCPDCGASVSDRLEACPKCGCPFTEQIKAGVFKVSDGKPVEMSGGDRGKKIKINAKQIGIIVAIVVIAAAVACAVWYAVNYKNIQLQKADGFINSNQYNQAVEILEKYKEDPALKEKYENAVFMTSEEGQFLTDFAAGLMKRWDISMSSTEDTTQAQHYKALVNAELDCINKYRDRTFKTQEFTEKVQQYITALDMQIKALDYYTADYSRYSTDWAKALGERSVIVTYFLNHYPVKIDEKYNDIKEEFISTASAVTEKEELKNQIDKMVHESDFTQTRDSGNWKEYSMQVENKTDKTFQYFGLVINCIDEDGNILDQTYTNQIKAFAPGQKAAFEFQTDTAAASFTWNAEYYIQE